MQAILLAGGLGTRLRPVVSDRPKPMADVCGKPFLEYLLRELKSHGVCEIIMAVGYKGNMVEEYFGDGKRFGLSIRYSYEESPLGTAGAVKNAGKQLEDDAFLVLNADTFYRAAYKSLIDLFREDDYDMALVLREVPDVSRYGSVRMEKNRVIGFNEKTTDARPGLINGGIYMMDQSILSEIPGGVNYSLENELIPSLLQSGGKIGAVVNDGYFIDIGVPEDYYRFVKDVESGEAVKEE